MTKEQHALERTSPKGGPFIGTCMKCGKPGLTPADFHKNPCVNPAGLTQQEVVIMAIEGPKEQTND